MSKNFKLVSYNIGNGTNGFIEEDNTQQSYNKVISSILNRKKTLSTTLKQINLLKELDSDFILLQELTGLTPMNSFVDTKSVFSQNFTNSNYDYQYYPNLYQFNGYLEHGKATLVKKEHNCYFFNHAISNDKNDYIRIKLQRRKKQISYLKALKLYANAFILNNRSMIESTIKIKNGYLRIYNTHLIPGEMNQNKRILELTKILYILNREYNKGNYVILGGNFNFDLNLSDGPASFPEQFKKTLIKNNWQLLTPHNPTYKNMLKTQNPNYQFRNLDGFITSPNIDITNITNIKNWELSDHTPIITEFKVK